MVVSSLEHIGLTYDPDLVIYGNVGNDHCLPNFIRKERGFFDFESYIALYLDHMQADDQRGFSMIKTDWTICTPADAPAAYAHMVGYEGFSRQLDRLERISKRESLPVVFFSLGNPSKEGTLLTLARSHESLRIIRNSATARWLEAGNRWRKLTLRADSHPSAMGYRLYAQSLHEGLIAADFYGLLKDLAVE